MFLSHKNLPLHFLTTEKTGGFDKLYLFEIFYICELPKVDQILPDKKIWKMKWITIE